MSLMPAYFGRKRESDPEPPPPEEADTNESRREVFNLIPPRAETLEKYQRPELVTPIELPEPEPSPPAATPVPAAPVETGRNVHPAGAMDLARLSIDNDGRLYWDGKPVEVRRRIAMSRGQIMGATLIGVFVVISGLGAAIHGSAVAHEWGCRLGWLTSYCGPAAPTPAPRADIPA